MTEDRETNGKGRPSLEAPRRQISELLRDLQTSDLDQRDAATEELGRRIRSESGDRVLVHLRAAGHPPDPDVASRIQRLQDVRDRMERLSRFQEAAHELRERLRRLRRRIASWERYREEADPGTATGTWIVENLGSVDRLIGMLRARLEELDSDRTRLEEAIAEAEAVLEELPGGSGA